MALDFPSSPVNGQVYDNFVYNSAKGTWKSLSSGASPSLLTSPTITNAVITATAPNSTTVPLTVNGAASQSANLQEWRNSSNSVLSRVDQYGGFVADSPNNGSKVLLKNPTAGSSEYLNAISLHNDSGYKAVHFLNSSTRTTDGGANGYTIRNDGGPFNLGNNGFATTIYGTSVTMPNQVYFLAFGNAVGNVTYNAGSVLQFQNIRRQIGSSYNTSNGRFTAPVSGNYFLWFEAFNNGGQHRVSIRINGSANIFGQGMQNSGTNFHQAGVTYLAAGDYVEVRTAYDNTVVYSSDNHLEFGGMLLG